MSDSRLGKIMAAADKMGDRSFQNYVQIRSVAEQIRDGFCAWLDSSQQCVFLVPPQGPFQAQNYRSAAFSVSGKGFLPLEPISFGLAVKVTAQDDYMRMVLTCRKEGDRMFVQVENQAQFEIDLPVSEDRLNVLYEDLYGYLLSWFESRIENYDHGRYGMADIGFDIQRMED